MTPERYRRIGELYHAALEVEAAHRDEFLDRVCAGDDKLRHEVDSLIAAHEHAADFIAVPALSVAAELLARSETDALIGQTIGRYRILSPLGAGGMGRVYLAEDTQLRRRVALKFLPEYFTHDKTLVERFRQEARAASALNHPNILTVYDFGQMNGIEFIACEYVEGETLRKRLTRSRIELSELLEVSTQIASALTAAHQIGIIHRDIKSDNIMLRQDGLVKVLDFGLVKLSRSYEISTNGEASTRALVATDPGVVMGTAYYMSPEQAQSFVVDARTDIWSIGVVLYEMAAGRLPFQGPTTSHVIVSILEQQPPPLKEYAPEVPGELVRIIYKALEKDCEQRYQVVKDLALDLKELKQQMQFELALGRSEPRDLVDGTAGTAGSGQISTERVRDSVAGTLEVAAIPPTSTAGYLVTGIKRHKAVTLLGLGVLMLALVVGAYLNIGHGTSKTSINSIAVLPFENATLDSNTEYLSDGIPEGIINSLSQLPNLKVMSRNSAFHYKGKDVNAQTVARELTVQAVVTGRVTQRGEDLAISVELVNAQDNSQIWGQQYNRRLADVFTVQQEIAKEISEQLRLKLTGGEQQQLSKSPTENLKAFQYYMQGRAYTQRRTREDLLTAIRYYEQAIAEDRHYALAYAGLADAYSNLGVRGYIAPQEGRRKTDEAARQALALDEDLAESHIAIGQVYLQFLPLNLPLGEREMRRALQLSPSLAMAHQYLGLSFARQGRLDEASAEYLNARELDPLSPIVARLMAVPYYLKRDHVRALELLRQANQVGPAFSVPLEIGVYVQNRKFDEALAELEKAKRERPGDPVLIYSTGVIYAAQGDRAAALQIVKELETMSGASPSQAQQIAKIYATLNEKELALTWLERGFAAGDGAFYKDEPLWDPIRNDPRFADLLRRMGFPS